jgi:RluA family pseudouridine synthase
VQGAPAKPSQRVKAGEVIRVAGREAVEAESAPLITVLHANESLLVADKPAGLLTHPTGRVFRSTLVAALEKQCGFPALRAVHRLDRETSGLVVLARTVEASRILARMFGCGSVRREYVAVLTGESKGGVGAVTVTKPVPVGKGKAPVPAATAIQFFGHAAGRTVVRIVPMTGRRHQIRFHCASIGHPILGDERYGGVEGPCPGRLYLHARGLEFEPHPIFGGCCVFETPLPPDFLRVAEQVLGDGLNLS